MHQPHAQSEQDKNYISDFDREVKKVFVASARSLDGGGKIAKKKKGKGKR